MSEMMNENRKKPEMLWWIARHLLIPVRTATQAHHKMHCSYESSEWENCQRISCRIGHTVDSWINFCAMTWRQRLAWFVVWPIFVHAIRAHNTRHYRPWYACPHVACRCGRWAERTAYIIALD